MKGTFITFEGPDGAGKTTQINMLSNYLRSLGKKVVLTREPGGTEISEEIRSLLLDISNKKMLPKTELLLYAAARAQHVYEKILPAMEEGNIVISDRFVDSTIAYQGYGRGIDIGMINELNMLATGGLKPELTILLDLDVITGLTRVRGKRGQVFDRLEAEDTNFHEKVRQGFLEIAKKEPWRVKVILADKDPLDIFSEIKEYVQKIPVIKEVRNEYPMG